MSFFQLIGMFFRLLLAMFKLRRLHKDVKYPGGGLVALDAVLSAYRRGDYEEGLAASEGLKVNGQESSTSLYFKGANLMNLGRLDEAEEALNASAKLENDGRKMALRYSTLGELMIEQQRYDAAHDCFDKSARLWPGRGMPDRDAAECLLHQQSNPSDAVSRARTALQKEKSREALSSESQQQNISECLATLAWAVAESSRDRTEVDRLVSEAVPMIERAHLSSGHDAAQPVIARVHYYCGRAYAALGDPAKCTLHFEEAAKQDPKGTWGRRARAIQV